MSIPQLPTELLYDILEKTWSSHLTPAERVQLMTASRLVSRTWFALYDHIFSNHIHILSKSFYYHLFNDATRDFSRCTSITFTVCDAVLPTGFHLAVPRMLEYMSRFDMKKLTSLAAVNITYYNAPFSNPCMQGFFFALPDYLPRLSISYTFSPDIPLQVIDNMRQKINPSYNVRYVEPQVGTLEVNGASERIAAMWEGMFPGRERLLIDGKEEKQSLKLVNNSFQRKYASFYHLRCFAREMEYELHSLGYGHSDDKLFDSPLKFVAGLDKSEGGIFRRTEIPLFSRLAGLLSTQTMRSADLRTVSRLDFGSDGMWGYILGFGIACCLIGCLFHSLS